MTSNKSLTLSIVIPVYNEENYLKDCLQAIAKQSMAPDKVIVVDNNSTDGSVAICQRFPFVELLHESRQGIVFARNTGFDQVQTDIIARIDADTVISHQWVETIKNYAAGMSDKDAMTGPCTFRNAFFPRLDFVFHRVVYFWSSRLLFGHPTLFGSNMFLFRKTWRKVRKEVCLTNNIHEDMDLSQHITNHGGQVYFQPALMASISNRRFHKWGRYPIMWLYSRLIHLRSARTSQR